MEKVNVRVSELPLMETEILRVKIVGDSDLVLNKMNAATIRQLTDQRKDKAKRNEERNMWEDLITSLHWKFETPTDFTEKGLYEALDPELNGGNAPCITGFGLKRSFGDAVVRSKLDKYRTSFDANVNINDAYIPITFAQHIIDEKLMSPKKGSPVLAYINRFAGWSAIFDVEYITGGAYSAEQILDIINRAGFGCGIGGGRPSGYGRYHVESIDY